jgi:hypothetical protein
LHHLQGVWNLPHKFHLFLVFCYPTRHRCLKVKNRSIITKTGKDWHLTKNNPQINFFDITIFCLHFDVKSWNFMTLKCLLKKLCLVWHVDFLFTFKSKADSN